jgi:hypothetical protein
MFIDGYLSLSGAQTVLRTVEVRAGGTLVAQDEGAPAVVRTGRIDNYGDIGLLGTSELTFGPGEAGQLINHAGGVLDVLPGGSYVLDGELVNDGEIYLSGPTELTRTSAAGSDVSAQHVNNGLISLAAASLDILLAGASPSSITNAGTIHLEAGAALSVANATSPASQILSTATAVLEGAGTVDVRTGVPTGINNGTIRPGTSPGVLTWLGSIPMGTTGTIAIELEGTAPGTGHDQLNLSADLLLNLGVGGAPTGNLVVTSPGFVPPDGSRYPILTFRERFGTFADVDLPVVSGVTFDTLWVDGGASPDTLVIVTSGGPATEILGDWPLDEDAGQMAFDVLGPGNHGVLGTGATADPADPTWTAGRVGSALAFGGAQLVQVLDHPTLEPSTMTVEAFVRGTAPGFNRYIVSKGGGPGILNNAAYALYTHLAGGLVFYTSLDGGTTYYPSADAGSAVWDGNWHHVAGTFDGSAVRLFVDGAEVDTSRPAAIGYATPETDLIIGALHGNGTFGFNGDIDEVRIWGRVLSPSEIALRASRGGGAIPLGAVIGPSGTNADEVDAPGNPVNLVGTASNTGATTLAAAAAGAPTFDFNTYGGVDRTSGFDRSDLLTVRADMKHDSTALILDLDNDGSFTGDPASPGFGMHANRFITFDLAEIRSDAGLASDQAFVLAGVAGPANFFNATGMALAVLIDGTPAVMHDLAGGASTSLSFSVPVSGSARYLTFVTLDGPGGGPEPFGDHGGFAHVTLIIP